MKVSELIEHCCSGDRKSWALFVRYYYDFVYYVTDKLLTPSLVDADRIKQVVSDAFKALSDNDMARLKEYAPGALLFPAYLRQIVIDESRSLCERDRVEFKFSHLVLPPSLSGSFVQSKGDLETTRNPSAYVRNHAGGAADNSHPKALMI